MKMLDRRGQATMEYFILLTVLASLTLLAISRFFLQVRSDVEGFTTQAATAMVNYPGW